MWDFDHTPPALVPSSHDGHILPQPDTRPISKDQLNAEAKGIYAGLVMVESKCIKVDTKVAKQEDGMQGEVIPTLTDDQWQALFALHRTLLHEHHDFFLGSRHPSPPSPPQRLASKHIMVARWRRVISYFLELLRHRLPDSHDHMLALLYLDYSMMVLLHEAVDQFGKMWLECLGDLARNRLAIEKTDDDIPNMEALSNVAKFWYSKAVRKLPDDHLAILAGPNALQQVINYTKSVTVAQRSTTVSSAYEKARAKTREDMREESLQLQPSVHDATDATEYCHKFKAFSDRFPEGAIDEVRDYLGATRKMVGWKALLDDPDVDSAFEMIHLLTPQILADLVHVGRTRAARSEARLIDEWGSDWLLSHELLPFLRRTRNNGNGPRVTSQVVEPGDYPATDQSLDTGYSAKFWFELNKPIKRLFEQKKRALHMEAIFFPGFAKVVAHLTGRRYPDVKQNSPGSIRKRGLEGLVNGNLISALPDTGSDENIVSEAFIQKHRLQTTPSSQELRLGNSTTVRSKGTVTIRWAFADNPGKKYPIICQVLPGCLYDLILGKAFEKAVETYSKYRSRLTQCDFPVAKVFRFNLIGNASQRLEGILGSKHRVFAVPDTGAECNVMDADFARRNNYHIDTYPYARNHLQFANGSIQETIGQVHTNWTFTDGTRIPVTFEVLDNCAADLVLGEEIVYNHNAFETYASSITEVYAFDEPYLLAPFGLLTSWQSKATNLAQDATSMFRKSATTSDGVSSGSIASAVLDTDRETRRRQAWNQQFDYGALAEEDEKQAERERRRCFDEQISRTEATMRSAVPASDTRNRGGRVPSVRILGRGEGRA